MQDEGRDGWRRNLGKGLYPEGSSGSDGVARVWQVGGVMSSKLYCLPGEKDTEGRGREEEVGSVRKRLYQHITSRENRVPGLREGLGVRWNKFWRSFYESESHSVVCESATPWTVRSLEFSSPEYCSG